MKYLAGQRGGLFGDERLLWSGRMVLSGDALGTDGDSTGVLRLLGLFTSSQLQKLAPENTTCWKKMIDWKIDLFFITENFLGILDRLCAEPMRRSHDFFQFDISRCWVNIR